MTLSLVPRRVPLSERSVVVRDRATGRVAHVRTRHPVKVRVCRSCRRAHVALCPVRVAAAA